MGERNKKVFMRRKPGRFVPFFLHAALAVLGTSIAHIPSAFAQESSKPARQLDVWFVPTPHQIVDRMLDVASVRTGDVVYDLGCGDGRMVIAAAKKFATRGVGVDLDPKRIREARASAKKEGVEHLVTFEVGDMFKTDIREATVVMLYLLPELNRRLKPKLLSELRPGARVVSHDFDMGKEWPPDEYIKLGTSGVYLWRIPEKEEKQ
jgi:ubiquinone/menaquinone biosynthesis C-methylase UbiE